MELRDRVALVTGASSGLGRALAESLAAAGMRVGVGYRTNAGAARRVCESISAAGCHAVPIAVDQALPASVDEAVRAMLGELGRIDVLVNCAAWSTDVAFEDLDTLTPALWDRILQTNLRGPFLMARACAPHLKASGAGRIVNVAGGSAFTPSGSSIAQAVAKAGLVHLTRCLAVALAPEVTVNAVAPGLMLGTGMASRVSEEGVAKARARAALKRTTRIEDVCEQVLTFCRAESVTGETVVLDGGHAFR